MESERLLTPAPHGPYAVRSKQADLIVHKTAGKVWTQKLTEHVPLCTLYGVYSYSLQWNCEVLVTFPLRVSASWH